MKIKWGIRVNNKMKYYWDNYIFSLQLGEKETQHYIFHNLFTQSGMRARIARGKNACKLKVDRHNKNSGFRHNLSYAVLLTVRIITIKEDICETNRSTPEKTGIEKITQR